MKNIAIIAEYNPFHNGHAYMIEKVCEKHREANIVVVMSGNFVQRAEPAIFDKWARAKMALMCGADIVIELPFLYACRSAEGFAGGAVRLINALGCIDMLAFGSECADIAPLSDIAMVLADEPKELKEGIGSRMTEGVSFPRARDEALKSIMGGDAARHIDGPNNILAIEYLKALYRTKSHISPFNVPRAGAGYSDGKMHNGLSSATAIRRELTDKGINEAVLGNIPGGIAEIYRNTFMLKDFNEYFRLVSYKLRTMGIDEIENIAEVSEGLERRIKQAAQNAESLDGLVMDIKSKRYTYTRIKRILLNCLFGITKDLAENAGAYPLYARVLGFRRKSDILPAIAKNSSVPVITKPSEFFDSPLLSYDILATDVYSLLFGKVAPASLDYTKKLVVV